jgi:ATP-dependent Clp protease ATP-binding subunit ClpA
MRGEERPLAQFCFLGQTGCGKTELAKQLAKTLDMTLTRFDMSEYSSKETVSKFIGASPGYVGFENAGQLTEAVIRSPNSVILLDEIEKADPVVFNLLLQVMDYGTLTDNQGRKADFRSAVIIMTGNIGGHTLSSSKGRLGFGEESLCRKSTVEEEAAKFFSPEFRARLDGVIVFNPINSALMRKITEKHLRGWLESPSFKRKNISVHISEKAKDYIAAKGYDAKLGARPVTRVINEEIQAPLADEILFGKLSKGGTVTVDETGGRLDIEVRAANPAVKTSAD